MDGRGIFSLIKMNCFPSIASKAKRRVACVQMRMVSSDSKNPKNAFTLLFSPPGVHKLYLGLGSQLAKNPCVFKSV